MAHGMPDYNKDVRPKYGGALQKKGSLAVDASVPTRLTNIEGKGVLYGGVVWLDPATTQANSAVLMKLDGTLLSSLSFVRMADYGVNNPRNSVFTLNKYDSVNKVYSVGLSYGITFESYLDLYYYETYGNTPTVFWDLVYALI